MRRLKNKCNFWSYKVKKEKMAMGHILRMNPVFKEMIWGGTKLKTVFNKKSELNILAEVGNYRLIRTVKYNSQW